MYQTVSQYDFIQAFNRLRPDNFSYEGLAALFDYLEADDIELDIIGICCDFTEYKSFEEIQEDYQSIKTIDDLLDNTIVLDFKGGIIIQNF